MYHVHRSLPWCSKTDSFRAIVLALQVRFLFGAAAYSFVVKQREKKLSGVQNVTVLVRDDMLPVMFPKWLLLWIYGISPEGVTVAVGQQRSSPSLMLGSVIAQVFMRMRCVQLAMCTSCTHRMCMKTWASTINSPAQAWGMGWISADLRLHLQGVYRKSTAIAILHTMTGRKSVAY